MELSSVVLEGLTYCGDIQKLDDKSFEVLSRYALESIISKVDIGSALGDSSLKRVDGSVLKLCLYSLVTLFVEATKHDIDEHELQSILDECRFSSERITYTTKLFQKQRPTIAAHLKSISYHLPHIVDVDWRLDYCIKSDMVEKIDEPVYLIKLHTEENSSDHDALTFNCTLDHLQDLVSKLKDSVKSLERLYQG